MLGIVTMANFKLVRIQEVPDGSGWTIADGELFSDDHWPIAVYRLVVDYLNRLEYGISVQLPEHSDFPLKIELNDGCVIEIQGDWGLGFCYLSAPNCDGPSIALVGKIAYALPCA
jgi:hypothetical protein